MVLGLHKKMMSHEPEEAKLYVGQRTTRLHTTDTSFALPPIPHRASTDEDSCSACAVKSPTAVALSSEKEFRIDRRANTAPQESEGLLMQEPRNTYKKAPPVQPTGNFFSHNHSGNQALTPTEGGASRNNSFSVNSPQPPSSTGPKNSFRLRGMSGDRVQGDSTSATSRTVVPNDAAKRILQQQQQKQQDDEKREKPSQVYTQTRSSSNSSQGPQVLHVKSLAPAPVKGVPEKTTPPSSEINAKQNVNTRIERPCPPASAQSFLAKVSPPAPASANTKATAMQSRKEACNDPTYSISAVCGVKSFIPVSNPNTSTPRSATTAALTGAATQRNAQPPTSGPTKMVTATKSTAAALNTKSENSIQAQGTASSDEKNVTAYPPVCASKKGIASVATVGTAPSNSTKSSPSSLPSQNNGKDVAREQQVPVNRRPSLASQGAENMRKSPPPPAKSANTHTTTSHTGEGISTGLGSSKAVGSGFNNGKNNNSKNGASSDVGDTAMEHSGSGLQSSKVETKRVTNNPSTTPAKLKPSPVVVRVIPTTESSNSSNTQLVRKNSVGAAQRPSAAMFGRSTSPQGTLSETISETSSNNSSLTRRSSSSRSLVKKGKVVCSSKLKNTNGSTNRSQSTTNVQIKDASENNTMDEKSTDSLSRKRNGSPMFLNKPRGANSPRGSSPTKNSKESGGDPSVNERLKRNEERVSNADPEAVALQRYIRMIEADLSKSTFQRVGALLSASRTLRVVNLKGSTIQNEGLLGLADIPSLHSVCVSHIPHLTSLKPLITRRNGQISTIREIKAHCTSIDNEGIEGLETLTRLQRLDLSLTRVTCVYSLVKSRSLMELILTATHVTAAGILGLEDIPTLKTLNINRTKVRSLCDLSKSKSLEHLFAYSCKIDDEGLHGVERMPNLQTLDISTSKVRDLSILALSKTLKSITAQWLPLRNCGNIVVERRSRRNEETRAEILSDEDGDTIKGELSEISLSDFLDKEAAYRGLANIPTLEHIDLSYCTIRSIKSLFASKSIKSLVLRRTHVDSEGLRGIEELRTLQSLIISNSSDPSLSEMHIESSSTSMVSGILTTVTDLSLVLQLAHLDLSYTDVYDLRMLSALPHLRELRLVETLVTVDGLRGIERLPSLQVLDLSQTSVISLQFLSSGCVKLCQLYLRSNRNARGFRVGNIHQLPALELLDVSDTVVEDIKMLFRSTCKLKKFIWRWGERRDATGHTDALPSWIHTTQITGIEVLPRLELLDITNSVVDSVAFLSVSKSLRHLRLSRCARLGNAGIVGIQKIPTLEVLDVSYATGITDVRCLGTAPSLRELHAEWTGLTVDGLQGITLIPTLKILGINSTPAEESVLRENAHKASLGAADVSRLSVSISLNSVSHHRAESISFLKHPKRRVSFIS